MLLGRIDTVCVCLIAGSHVCVCVCACARACAVIVAVASFGGCVCCFLVCVFYVSCVGARM